MKHYKSVEILSILECQAPPHKPKAPAQKRKAPLLKTFWRRFCSDVSLMCQGLLVHDLGMLFLFEWRCCGRESVHCFTGALW